jgi:predicted aminopeptidase
MMIVPYCIQRFSRHLVIPLLLLSLNGCAVGYYWQAGAGHLQIVNGQEPIATVLENPQLEPTARRRLQVSQRAVEFAHDTLRLPDNGSYSGYYNTGAPYVVWNVFAAPELSLEPRTWCFPVAGCIAYRGYFKEGAAHQYADRLAARGDDVFVGGITAYSTLGRFRDPVLNTMLTQSEAEFVGLLFHELAHQHLYVQDDSAFNEAFATAVEIEGLRRWQIQNGKPVAADDGEQRAAVLSLLRAARQQLNEIYVSDRDASAKRAAKLQVLDGLAGTYGLLVVEWQSAGLKSQPYARLFRQGLNNASLAAIATYDDYVPAFGEILRQCGAWLACFYVRADALAALAPTERTARMRELLKVAIDRKQ